MNKDEFINLVGPIVAITAPMLAKYGFSAGDLTAFLTGGIGIAFAMISHWNMRKVPETAKVIIPAAGGATAPVGATITGKVVA